MQSCIQEISRQPHSCVRRSLANTYQTVSSASVDVLWQVVVNLADVSWHPLLKSTNAPNGLTAKPGLIYKAFTARFPLPIRIFVERVDHRELLSIRVYVLPGLEERVTYRIESAVCGTQISYSVTLRGWLSPLAWSLIRPHAAKVASALAIAAEQVARQALAGPHPSSSRPSQDLLG
ncbi:MAG: SRPBCC family protein [Leptolyngbya sp. SIO4C5]|uniref:SRPBCC family protein n=1 Tax=Sphaerothrix gracilis TaxID=3151835 RepID=UPI0013BFF582|nr:SRPBCC family protein [Leptolyngbya sp. SIO4C5]